MIRHSQNIFYEVQESDVRPGASFRVKSIDWFNDNKILEHDGGFKFYNVPAKSYQFDFNEDMSAYCGEEHIVDCVFDESKIWKEPSMLDFYFTFEDIVGFYFTPEMIEYL